MGKLILFASVVAVLVCIGVLVAVIVAAKSKPADKSQADGQDRGKFKKW